MTFVFVQLRDAKKTALMNKYETPAYDQNSLLRVRCAGLRTRYSIIRQRRLFPIDRPACAEALGAHRYRAAKWQGPARGRPTARHKNNFVIVRIRKICIKKKHCTVSKTILYTI